MKTIIITMTGALLLFAGGLATAAPAVKGPVLKPVATCADGKTYSNASGEHRGACSGHGGVVSWADGSPVRARGRASSYK